MIGKDLYENRARRRKAISRRNRAMGLLKKVDSKLSVDRVFGRIQFEYEILAAVNSVLVY